MKTREMPIIELQGTPRERGRIHGESLKIKIFEVIDNWLSDLGSYGQNDKSQGTLDTSAYLQSFFSETGYIDAIKRWTPDLLAEVQGIAEASGQTFEHILGLNLMDEEWVYGLRHKLEKPTNKCTAFGIPQQDNGPGYAGQNMDIMSWAEGKQVLLRVMPTDSAPETLVFSIAGSIGLNGLNANGIGVTCNTLSQLNYTTDGLPVAFILRSILASQTVDSAEIFLESIQHASGQNFIVSSAKEIRCFECCGTSVVRYQPDQLKGRVIHTNHPLINTDISPLAALSGSSANTKARLESIACRLGDTTQTITLKNIKSALAAHDDQENPVSRNANKNGSSIGFTAGASIYELGRPPRLHLAAGPPCETEFKAFDFLDTIEE